MVSGGKVPHLCVLEPSSLEEAHYRYKPVVIISLKHPPPHSSRELRKAFPGPGLASTSATVAF